MSECPDCGRTQLQSEVVVRRAVWGGAALTLGRVISRLTAAVATVFVARLVGPTEMAVWAVVSSFTNIGWSLADLGVGAALVRGWLEPDLLAFRQAGGMQIASVTILVMIGVAAWSMLPLTVPWAPTLPGLLVFTSLGMLVKAFRTPTRAWLERHMQFVQLAIVEVAETMLRNVTLVVGLYCGLGVWAFALSAVVGELAAVGALWAVPNAPALFPSFGLSCIRPHLSFAVAFQAGNLVNLAREAGTPILLAAVFGPTVTGMWAWVRKLMELAYSFLSIGWRVTFPAYARLGQASEWKRVAQGILVTTHWPLLLLAVGLVGAGSWPLDAVFGRQWHEAHPALYVALAALAFSGPVSVATAGGILAQGGASRLVVSQLLHTLVLWVLAMLAVPWWGVLGVAAGWVGAAVVDSVLLLMFANGWRPATSWMLRSFGAAVLGVLLSGTLRAVGIVPVSSLLGVVAATLPVLLLNMAKLGEFFRLSRSALARLLPKAGAAS